MCVALYDHVDDLKRTLPAEASCTFLHSRSIAKSLVGQRPPAKDTVITVISRWPDFLQWARTTLVAVGLDPQSLDTRDARAKGWDRGLTPAASSLRTASSPNNFPAPANRFSFALSQTNPSTSCAKC